MRYLWCYSAPLSFIACLLAHVTLTVNATELMHGDVDAGRKLYMYGLNSRGAPVVATTQGDVQFTGAQFSCVSCHRPSGFGSSEGGYYVPPITGPKIFNPAEADRVERFKEMFQELQPSSFWAQVREPRLRPAYDEKALSRVLREGINPNGERLNLIMPRYDISDVDVANLIAFLRTLSAEIDLGVEKHSIHFATVLTEDADKASSSAVLKTMSSFFTWINKDTEGDLEHPNFSPGYRSTFLDAYRRWVLHVWELKGAPESWPRQLEAYYSDQPVFAVVSGLVQGPWDRIGDFCDEQHLPCLFPNTDLPRLRDIDHRYSFYFSGGLGLEARAIATHLSRLEYPPKVLTQIWHDGPYGAIPARAFITAIKALAPDTIIENVPYRDIVELDTTLKLLHGKSDRDALVLWPGQNIKEAISSIVQNVPTAAVITLPFSALEPAKNITTGNVIKRVIFSHPYELPTRYHPRKFRVRAWMHSRRLNVTHPRLQYQTYYALTLLQYGLSHLLADFHRDYLIELIEHEAENRLNPGTHPSLALGPGQRLASKGAYIVQLDPNTKGGFKALTEWIVP